MTTETDTHPVTAHLRQAAEQIRQAIHATHNNETTIVDLYPALGDLHQLLIRLPHLVKYFQDSITNIAPDSCYHDSGGNVLATLIAINDRLENTSSNIDAARLWLSHVWSQLGHLGITDQPMTPNQPHKYPDRTPDQDPLEQSTQDSEDLTDQQLDALTDCG